MAKRGEPVRQIALLDAAGRDGRWLNDCDFAAQIIDARPVSEVQKHRHYIVK